MNPLEVKNIKLAAGDNIILENFSLAVGYGEIHALIGENGAGKSSLAKAIARYPGYTISSGEILLTGESILEKSPDEVARAGFFLAFQNPVAIPGVTVANFIRAAVQARTGQNKNFNAINFYKELYEKMDLLKIDRSFSSRSINDDFSGGEKKRCEILQMMMLHPSFAILDEIDSGLDVDAMKIVSKAISSMKDGKFSAIVITHQSKFLEYINPDHVHIISKGKIAASGGNDLVYQIEKLGYDFLKTV